MQKCKVILFLHVFQAEEISNIKIFRFDSALFFANSEYFKSSLYKMTVDPKELREKQKQLDKRRKKEEAEMLNVTVVSCLMTVICHLIVVYGMV